MTPSNRFRVTIKPFMCDAFISLRRLGLLKIHMSLARMSRYWHYRMEFLRRDVRGFDVHTISFIVTNKLNQIKYSHIT